MTDSQASNDVGALFHPRSVALVGASSDGRKASGLPLRFLRAHGFDGAIYPINPTAPAIDGIRCYPDVTTLPEAPDVAMVLTSAERSIDAVRQLAKRGTRAAIILASGFAEAGDDGRARQQALVAAAGSMRLLGPNTIGLVNVTDRITLSASGALAVDAIPSGIVGVASQSGGILGSLLSRAVARGLGLSKLVSTSNEADVDLADVLAYFADDASTTIAVLYIEAIRNAEKFKRAAAAMARAGKSIVALKVGRSDAGARAAVSHTGALAGSNQVYDALFRRLGIIQAQTFSDLLDIPATLVAQPRLGGRRIAVLTSTGGAGTLVADALGAAGFELPPPDENARARIKALLPGVDASLAGNPIDVTLAGLAPKTLAGSVAALAGGGYDGIVAIVGSSGVARPELVADAVAAGLDARVFPVLAYVSPHSPDAVSRLAARGVPAFSEPENLARAMAALAHTPPLYEAFELLSPLAAPAVPPELRVGALDEAEAKALFAECGIASAREQVVTTAVEAEAAAGALGGSVVLKLLSAEITHKTDVGGVALAQTPATIAARMQVMKHAVVTATGKRIEKFLVQETLSGGVETILGLRRDPLGACVLIGMGGTTAELVRDTSLRLLPLARDDARAMITELKTAPLLFGYRGRPKADVAALEAAIVAFARMIETLGPRLIEAEINPLFVLPEGQGVRAADGVAVFAD